MDVSYDRRLADMGSNLASRFETSIDRIGRSSSRPAPSTRTSPSTTAASSPDRQSTQSKPLKGILKTTTTQTTEPKRAEEPSTAEERSHDLLARRFYRVPRPEQLHTAPPALTHAPPYALPQLSPQYYSDNSFGSFDMETDSACSSELSVNTQATSVASDETIASPRKSSTQVHHVRRVPPPTVSRVKPRTRTRASSDAGKTNTTNGKSNTSNGRRTVNIQILPAEKKETKETSKDLELSKKAEKDLLDRIAQLESETESLRAARISLSQNLDDASERLSVKEFGNQEIERALRQERDDKELILRDFEKQTQLFDEFRSNFELQRGLLEDTEKERDGLRRARNKLEAQLSKMSKEVKRREMEQKDQEDLLAQQVTAFEIAAGGLENKVKARDHEVMDLTAELGLLQDDAKKRQAQLEDLTFERDELRKESEELSAKLQALANEQQYLRKERDDLAVNLMTLQTSIREFEQDKEMLQEKFGQIEGEKKDLEAKIEGFESEIKALKDEVAAAEPEKQALEKQLEEEKADKQLQIIKLTTDLDGAKAANVSLASQILDLETKKAKVQQILDDAQTKVAELKQGNGSLTSEAEQLKSHAAELEGDLKEKTAGLDELKARTADLEKETLKLAQLQEEHQKLEERATELQTALANSQASLDAASKNDSGPAPPTGEQSKETIVVVVDQLAQEKAELETRNQELQAQADTIPRLEESNWRLQVEADSRVAALESRAQELQIEADKVPVLTQQSQSLSAQLASANQQLQHVNAAYQAASAQVCDLQAAIDDLQQQQQQQQDGRTKSRSSSRRRRPDGHKRARSTSMLFVRKPQDRSAVHITTREGLRSSAD